MAWFCKRCTDNGIMDKEWTDADEFGVVFRDCGEHEMVSDICESCGPGYFNRYGNPIICESCEVDPEQKIMELVTQNESLLTTYNSLKKEMERYQTEIDAQVTDLALRSVKETFDAILRDETLPNTRLATLIYAYVKKIKEIK